MQYDYKVYNNIVVLDQLECLSDVSTETISFDGAQILR